MAHYVLPGPSYAIRSRAPAKERSTRTSSGIPARHQSSSRLALPAAKPSAAPPRPLNNFSCSASLHSPTFLAQRIATKHTHGALHCVSSPRFGRKSPDIGFTAALSVTDRHRSAASIHRSTTLPRSLVRLHSFRSPFRRLQVEGPAPGR